MLPEIGEYSKSFDKHMYVVIIFAHFLKREEKALSARSVPIASFEWF
jgi:hypothetical protein